MPVIVTSEQQLSSELQQSLVKLYDIAQNLVTAVRL